MYHQVAVLLDTTNCLHVRPHDTVISLLVNNILRVKVVGYRDCIMNTEQILVWGIIWHFSYVLDIPCRWFCLNKHVETRLLLLKGISQSHLYITRDLIHSSAERRGRRPWYKHRPFPTGYIRRELRGSAAIFNNRINTWILLLLLCHHRIWDLSCWIDRVQHNQINNWKIDM